MKIHGCFHSFSLGQNSKTFALDQTFEYLRGEKNHFSNVNTQSEMWLFLIFLDAWKFSTNFYNSHSAGFCYKCFRNYLGKYSIERERQDYLADRAWNLDLDNHLRPAPASFIALWCSTA
jgi:hypothetical protein